jgi:hypothetical protein
LSLLAVYHDYGAERVSRDYGTELNLQVQAKVGKFNSAIKYGDYQADGFLSDT